MQFDREFWKVLDGLVRAGLFRTGNEQEIVLAGLWGTGRRDAETRNSSTLRG